MATVSTSDLDSGTALARIVSTVASSLELEDVLRAVVRLLSEGSEVHACFVYLVEDDGQRLVLRAAGEPYEHLVGQIALERPRGLAWWAAEHNEPAFIPDNLLADPRVEYVPELEEHHFQSLLSVPVAARDGTVIGVISAHTVAPRSFTEAEVDFLVTSAALVAGAIENARLYDEARVRVRELEAITALAEVIASASSIDELLPAVSAHGRALLQAASCHIYMLDPVEEDLALRASSPVGGSGHVRQTMTLAELAPELGRKGRASRLSIPLVAGDDLLGLLIAEKSAAVEIAGAVANQIAVGIKRIQLIERLTERNLTKDFFEDLEAGRDGGATQGRASRLGFDLEAPCLVLLAETVDDALERTLAWLVPDSLFDRRENLLRGLLRIPPSGERAAADGIRRAYGESSSPVSIGFSNACCGVALIAQGFEQARQALLGARLLGREDTVVAFEELGAYKYLLAIAAGGGLRDATIDAVTRLAEYDAERGSSLLPTLEEFLARRGSITGTSEALYIHTNTLRQRLRRIGDLSGIDLRRDDWLMIEIAVKLVRLRLAQNAR